MYKIYICIYVKLSGRKIIYFVIITAILKIQIICSDQDILVYYKIPMKQDDERQPHNAVTIKPRLICDVITVHYNRRYVIDASHVCRTL